MSKHTITTEQLDDILACLLETCDDVRTSYIGRGMLHTCLGYTGQRHSAFTFQVATRLVGTTNLTAEEFAEEVTDKLYELEPLRDGMGTGIIYYWPAITVED